MKPMCESKSADSIVRDRHNISLVSCSVLLDVMRTSSSVIRCKIFFNCKLSFEKLGRGGFFKTFSTDIVQNDYLKKTNMEQKNAYPVHKHSPKLNINLVRYCTPLKKGIYN